MNYFFTSIACYFIVAFTLVSCESADNNIPVQQVIDNKFLSEAELQQFYKSRLNNQKTTQNTYYFGFDLRASPQEDAAQYLPFLKYLERQTGYHFSLQFTPKDSSTTDQLGMGNIQFAAMGATSFLDAHQKYNAISLVHGLNLAGKAEYQSVFVVKPDNIKIKRIEDFRGHTLAFGSKSSTQGHLIPRIMLSEHGLSLKDLKSYGYTGSHQNCAESVVSGKYDICGMQDTLAEKLAASNLIKIIQRSRFYPSSGIVASSSVPEDVIKKVTQALLDFKPTGKDRDDLYNWDRTEMPKGFVKANLEDYQLLLDWSIRLGFMHSRN